MSNDIAPKTLDPEYANTVATLTRAVRSADLHHEKVGGSSRHYVVDCLLPSLADEGLVVLSSAKVTLVSDDDHDVAALREQVATLTAELNHQKRALTKTWGTDVLKMAEERNTALADVETLKADRDRLAENEAVLNARIDQTRQHLARALAALDGGAR